MIKKVKKKTTQKKGENYMKKGSFRVQVLYSKMLADTQKLVDFWEKYDFALIIGSDNVITYRGKYINCYFLVQTQTFYPQTEQNVDFE